MIRLPMKARSRTNDVGFTLIELLVVVSIIAILIGILLPALSRGRDEAKAIACASNLKQMSVGLEVYAQDYKEQGPFAGGIIDWDTTDPDTNNESWMQQVHTYMENKEFFSGCGSYPVDSPYHYFLSSRAEYVNNIERYGNSAPVGILRGSVDGRLIRNTTAFVTLGDNQLATFDGGGTGLVLDADKDNYTLNAVFGGTGDYWEPQHNGTLNLSFADGHGARFEDFDAEAMTYRYKTMSNF